MKGQITGRHVLIGLIAFFGIVIGVNIIFVSSAVRSFPGEAVEKSYVQGINYNKTLEKREQQKALGWTAQIGEQLSDSNVRQLIVVVQNKDAAPVSGLTMTGRLSEHSDDHQQLDLVFTETTTGEYAAELPVELFGRWTTKVAATRSDGATFESMKTMVFK